MALSVAAVLAALTVTAQSDEGGSPDAPRIIPILASSELAVGPTRFLFGLADREGQPIASPDIAVDLRFYDVDADPDAVAFEAPSSFLWAVPDVTGLYVSHVDYPHAGRWATRFDATLPDGSSETVRVDYDVAETTTTPAIGAPAPAVDTPTAEDVDGDLAAISTDTHPLPRLYELSIEEAVGDGRPTVIAFATPAFCQSATCGPTLETVKAVANEHPDVDFVHVEPYVMSVQDGRLQPVLSAEGYLQAAPWTVAYGLVTEPYVLVVAADGTVRAKFEGAMSAAEIDDAIAALA